MHQGKCGCGAVTYRMKSDPIFVHCCHCKDCQIQTGSAFVLNAIVEADRVEIEGPVTQVTVPTPSGKGQLIHRCADCGVAVVSEYLVRLGKLRYVRVGTLDRPEKCPPDVHIFTKRKLPWVTLSDEVPVFEAFYSFKDIWPEESLARWDALFGN